MPPHNLEAEESLLGAMLLSRDAIAAAIEGVRPDDFYKPAHAHIYDAILALYGAGEPVDPVTIADELKRAGLLEAIGGRQILLQIQHNTPASANAAHYARIVEEMALLRRLISVAGEIAEMGYDLPDDVIETLDLAESKVFAVAERRVANTMVSLHDVLEESLQQLESLYGRGGGVTGVPTGFLDLDDLLHGLQPSSLVVLAARPSVGKSALALGAASHVALETRRPVIFFSLEMGHLELTQRMLAAEARVDSRKLRRGDLSDSDWTRIAHAVGRLGEAPFFIDDNPHCSVMEMRAKCRRVKSRHGDLGLVVVDYLQLMTVPGGRSESRQVEVSELSRGLKILARELEAPVMALSQLNRMPEMRQDKRPMLADLRESGCLTADTKIQRADTGEMVTIGSLLATGATNIPVWTIDHDFRMVRGVMTHAFRSGVKPVFRLRLRSGLEVKASPNHPFLTFDGWRRLDELQAGERIALPRRIPEPEQAIEWHDDQVILLAHLLGSGTFAVDQPLTYVSRDARHVDVVERAARTFGVEARRVDRGAFEQLYLSPPYHPCAWRENAVVDWLETIGLYGRRAKDAAIPSAAFGLPRRQLALFVRHLWSSGGRALTGSGVPTFCYLSPSRELVAGLQMLLFRFGILSRVRSVEHPGGAVAYELKIAGDRSHRRFLIEIGTPFVTASAAEGRVRELALDLVGEDALAMNPPDSPEPGGGRRNVLPHERQLTYQSAMGETYYGGSLTHPEQGRVRALQAMVDDDQLNGLSQTDLCWDAVESVDYLGEMNVYDATVPGTHNFIANGIVVHNSIEQDADVVTFIYRDEVYNPESPDRGQAEIIVAKHRNGPTGVVRLAFLEHLTKFENMARGVG